MKNQNTIKRITQKLLFVALLLLLLPCFAFGASTSLPDTKVKATAKQLRDAKVKKSPLQRQGGTLVNHQDTKPEFRSAEITHLLIGTESSGKWYWEATIKNTGNVELDGQHVIIHGYKISYPQAQNSWTPASGKVIGQGNILPNQSRVIKLRWNRCCMTDQLKVELRNIVTNKIFDTKILTSLVYSPSQYMPLDVRVKRITWNNPSWRAAIKNFSNYTVKVIVEGNLRRGSFPSTTAGVSTITIQPNSEANSIWLYTPGVQNGDILGVRIRVDMGGNNCNEPFNSKCRAKGEGIVIPNSYTYF